MVSTNTNQGPPRPQESTAFRLPVLRLRPVRVRVRAYIARGYRYVRVYVRAQRACGANTPTQDKSGVRVRARRMCRLQTARQRTRVRSPTPNARASGIKR
jgi:hypothetical protein